MRGTRGLLVLAAAATALVAAPQALGAVFTVTSADDGNDGACDAVHCSLREAINAANADAVADEIRFGILPAGSKTIVPTTPLPQINHRVTIDATTQPGFLGPPIVELDGTLAGAGAYGLSVASATGAVIRGVVVNRFTSLGVYLGTSSTLERSYIGTGLSGSTDLGNGNAGVYAGSNNVIGGTAAGAGNLISGNQFTGIRVEGDGNTVVGNVIGLDASATTAIGNCFGGIRVGGAGNVIGGTGAGARNVISGNGGCAVGGWAQVTVYQSTGGSTIQGNFIGTDGTGSTRIPSGDIGIRVMGTDDNLIGGSAPGAGNVITAPTTALDIGDDSGNLATGNVVRGNFIGTNAAGADLGPGGPGIVLNGSGTTVGGAGPERNVIANSASSGVYVISGTQNRLVENSIFGNDLLGIDLGADGVTPNDLGDADTGANDLQNHPVLASATKVGGATRVIGSLNSEPGTTYRIDFYASGACDGSGRGEGESWIGRSELTTDGSGNVSIDTGTGLTAATTVGQVVTATATDPDGNTSEFSACTTIAAGADETQFTVNSAADPGDGACTAGHCTLREAIAAANGDPGTETIRFAIGSGAVTISPASALPAITGPVVLDATTQPGYAGTPLVRLDGAGAGPSTPGLELVGGGSTVRGFAITSFTWDGVKVRDDDGNVVEDNYLGVYPSGGGVAVAGNGTYGVLVDFNSNGNVVRRNVVGANGFGAGGPYAGIGIHHDSAGTVVQENSVGLFGGPAGTAIPNALGVWIDDSSGTDLSENTIAHSTGAGVHVTGITLATELSENLIHSNGGLGIDLGAAGVTPNDTLDADLGPNGLQNFPVLTLVEAGDVTGTLHSRASTLYHLEFFSNAACDPSGNGEGARLLGSADVTTGPTGDAGFTVSLPLVAAGEFVTATATDPDGSTSEFSACRQVTAPSAAVSGLTLTSDLAQAPAGAKTVPLAAVPSSYLPVFSGRPTPVDSIPVDSIPVDSIGPGSTPVDSIPVDSIPVDSIPVDSIGFELVPADGLRTIQLSSLPLDWTAILAGSPLAGRPLQTLTLADLRGDAAAWARFEAISFADSGLGRSVLRGLPTAALMLGKATLAQIPNGDAWCAQLRPHCSSPGASTAVGLAIVGAPVDSIPLGSTPVDSIPVDSIPVDSIPVDSIDLAASRVGGILLRSLANPNLVVDCARISCTGSATLAGAAALNPSAIRPTARLAHLAGALGEITVNDVILGALPRAALDWETLPIAGLQRFAPAGDPIRYRLTFTLDCADAAGLSLAVKLPPGSLVLPGSSRFAYGLGPLLAGADPSTAAATGATWSSLPGQPCPTGVATQPVRLDFDALPGFRLGPDTASVRVTTAAGVSTADEQARLLVTQNWEANDEPAGAQTIVPDQLVIGHVAASGDRELFRLAVPATRGTRTTVLLSHIPEGADFDLAIEQPPAASLLANPVDSIPVDSIPVQDTGSSVVGEAAVLPPETLQDVPVDSIKVGSVSANRGNADEVATVVSQGETGSYTIVVSGYNGSRSDEPFVLRVRQTPPPPLPACPARTFPSPAGTRGVLPASLPASTQTLFVLNRERLNRLYGAAAVTAMRTAILSPSLLGRPEVAGALLEVDGDAAVRAAYSAWDSSPCSVDAANAVVRSINAVVARFRPSLPNLRNVVVLGTDEALPMARILDPTTISPERDNASALGFTTANGTRGNALYAAAATSHFLSDAPYGSTVTIPWLNRQLYLPQLTVGRLVETPEDVQRQVELYVAANGLLAPTSALTTAYDFLTDGGTAVKGGLDGLVGKNASRGLISDDWDAAQLQGAFTGKNPPDHVLSVNAHYDHWRLQPAAGRELVSTAALPPLPAAASVEPAFARRILFTMGCHAGLNVANSLLATPLPPQALDWVEGYARQRSAVYVANTGFGYGDTVSNALSERLMTLFADRLDERGSIGELWVKALADYHLGSGAYGVYDEKALQEATFYGLPFWRIGASPPAPARTPPAVVNDPVSGLPVAQLTVTPNLDEHLTARGRYWDDAGATLDIHYRPIQPRREVDVTVPGRIAKGVVIKRLVTNDVAGVDPATSLPTIDLSANEPERDFRDTVFPANLVNLTTARRLGELQQRLVVNAGQFRPSEPAGPTGVERLVLSLDVEVAYSSSADATPPQVRFVASTFSAGQAVILVEVAEPVARVAALHNDGTGWRFAELGRVGSSNRWTATVNAAGPVEVAAMAQDAAGNVGYSTNKGFNFLSVTDTAGPEILLESPAPGAVYTLGQKVNASYACSDPAGVERCSGDVGSGAAIDTSSLGEKVFTVTATDTGGRQTRVERRYAVGYPFEGFLPPVKNLPAVNVVELEEDDDDEDGVVPVKFRLGGNQGLDVLAPGSPRSQAIPCNSGALTEGTEPTTAAKPLSVNGGTYHYKWRPKASWAGTCRQLVVKLKDGSSHRANFRFVADD